tara:strand:+ start:603 stop:1349 length:747 start_codon:yes stop_codon:yes gene_type:complete
MLPTSFLSKIIEPNATVIDVGARDGDSLLPILPILKEGSHIIAFEPIKKEFDKLIKTLTEYNIPENQFTCNQFAIDSETGEADFLYDTEDRNGGLKDKLNSVLKRAYENTKFKTQSQWNQELIVQCFCWKDLKEDLKNKMTKASFIKVDTEGSDIVVLKELLPVIKKSRPFILFEWYPGTEKEFFLFLKENHLVVLNVPHEVPFFSSDMKTVVMGYEVPLGKLSYRKDVFVAPLEKYKNLKKLCSTTH